MGRVKDRHSNFTESVGYTQVRVINFLGWTYNPLHIWLSQKSASSQDATH